MPKDIINFESEAKKWDERCSNTIAGKAFMLFKIRQVDRCRYRCLKITK